MKKEIEKTNSTMRIGFIICIITASCIGIGAGAGFIIALILDRDIALIGAALGGFAGIIGAFLVPAFGGKVGQKFAEIEKPEIPNITNNKTGLK